MKRVAIVLLGTIVLLLLGLSAWLLTEPTDSPAPASAVTEPALEGPALLAHGEYLNRAGNCIGCHTRRGGQAFAGGRAIETPFGTIYSSNLTPDPETGLGGWTADDFWQALHYGRSKDGHPLTPAFPYQSYTHITRGDSDALFAYLQSLPAVREPERPHELRWPYDSQLLLKAWRRLYFKPGVFQPDSDKSEAWNRGAYLVEGLGHCGGCHTPRNRLGASDESRHLTGAVMPDSTWYAPSLARGPGAELGDWSPDDMAEVLKTGVSAHGVVNGPMLEVVRDSLQYLSEPDIAAIVTYLQDAGIPAGPRRPATLTVAENRLPAVMSRGERLYTQHCADCHKADGKGVVPDYPALDGNPAVTMNPASNTILTVLYGGFAPATAGNPRPYGMPPYSHTLSDEDVAAVVTYIRRSWSNRAEGVTSVEVGRNRASAE